MSNNTVCTVVVILVINTLGGGGVRCQTFSFSFFPCSADHERDWPPCKVVFFGLATNALNVRNNNNNNSEYNIKPGSQIRVSILFVTQLPSLERWALLPFLGFFPTLTCFLFFLNLLFLGTCIICFSQVLDFLWVFFILFYFSVPYFGLACDHGNSFLCLEE